jgi:hypothetical protein
VQTATETQIFPNKSLAMRAAEASGRNYTVEPVGERDVTKPWRVTLSAAKAVA